MSGGNLEYSGKIFGSWSYEPKYDGWRSLVNGKQMWNRHGAKLTINNSFATALEMLAEFDFDWYDVEALQRRHRIARGTLIVLDLPTSELNYEGRREIMEANFPILEVDEEPQENEVYIPPRYSNPYELWEMLKGDSFYEGIVGKKNNSFYVKQSINSDKSFPNWIKYRYK